VADGNSPAEIDKAVSAARESDRPTLISVKTHIGHGTPKQDTASAHGEPLGAQAMAEARKHYNWPAETFHIPAEVRKNFDAVAAEGAALQQDWNKRMEAYKAAYPAEYAELSARIEGKLPENLAKVMPDFTGAAAMATRDSSGKVINALAEAIPAFCGGSADLAPSNKTAITKYPERVLHFGIREHAMGAIVNALALHGGFVPFGATFLVFSDYMRPAVRLAALMQSHSIFVFTHDSIGVGEDGPTHQPIEHLAALRAIPELTVLRPADAVETAAAWEAAIVNKAPVCLALSRQKLPPVDTKNDVRAGTLKGAYTAVDCDGTPQIILIGTGSETQLACAAAKELQKEGIKARAVSMPSMELFAKQPAAYRDCVLPPQVKKRIAIEAGCSMCWHKWVGSEGGTLCVDKFGASAPDKTVFEKYGFTVANTVAKAKELLK